MDENLRHILNDSVGILSKLQLLSAFFEDETVFKIYVKTQVIHQLFESSRDLDVNKLELFHVQFTDTAIALLRKIKHANEQNVNLLYEEIGANRSVIERLGSSVYTESTFNADREHQALKIGLSLRKLYQSLADNTSEYPFSKNVNAFSARYAEDFFGEISPDLLSELIRYEPSEVYSNTYAVIQRRLMGQLHKQEFQCTFYTGLRAGSQTLEVYRFNENKYFLYLGSGNIFLFADPEKLPGMDVESGHSRKARLVRELTDTNTRLESRIAAAKTYIPDSIKHLLAEYYRKISDIDFLRQSDFEIQANILKTMLNTDAI
jgi:hypothetical protein